MTNFALKHPGFIFVGHVWRGGGKLEALRPNAEGNLFTGIRQGREAMEWVIGKINQEVHELAAATTSVVKTTDELISTAKHSVEDIAEKARKLGQLTDNMTVKAQNLSHLGETATQPPL